MEDLIGQSLDEYEIRRELGRGGMAVVYLAYQPSMEREVAIKVLPREFLHDRTFLERFKREARAIARLQHPHILPVHDFGEDRGWTYIVMAHMPGGSLADRIREGGMPLDEVVRFVEQIANALDYAHNQGVIHRDLKPSNTLLDVQGNVYLGDFGIAKLTEATAQLTGSAIIGTPSYMAPEMSTPEGLSPLVDIYALGVMLFEMVTGQQPYRAPTPMGVLMAHMGQPIPDARELRPDLPDAVQAVLERAMAKDPADRHPTARQLAADLRAAVASVLPTPPSAPTPPIVEPTVEVEMPPPVEPTLRAETPPPAEAPPVPEVPSLPKVAPAKPARRGVQPPWIVGGAGGIVVIGLVVVGLLVVGLALGGVFGQPAPEAPPVEEEEAAPAEEEIAIPELAFAGVTSNDEWTPYIQEFDGVPMALVPAGCFMMGSESWDSNEQPAHEVCFNDPFWIDVYEVTNTQFAEFLNREGNQTEGGETWLDAGGEDALIRESGDDWTALEGYADHPAIEVTWFGSTAYCRWQGGRLPTEAEWEYAARGPDGLVHPWGNEFVADNVVYGDNSGGETAEVGSRPGGASWVGALDLNGNVWEWVSSIFEPYPYDPTDGREVGGDSGSGSSRGLRGGSWDFLSDFTIRSAVRGAADPTESVGNLGLRCVRSY